MVNKDNQSGEIRQEKNKQKKAGHWPAFFEQFLLVTPPPI